MRVPPLVVRAKEAAGAHGFTGLCGDDEGALLHVIASGRGVGRAAEIGTGAGIGTAWLASALRPGVPLFTVGSDPDRAAAVAGLLADDPDVTVLEGDWRVVLVPEAPFDALFGDVACVGNSLDDVLALAAPRATVVLSGLSADRVGPERWPEQWLAHPRLDAIVVGTGATAQAIVGVVRG